MYPSLSFLTRQTRPSLGLDSTQTEPLETPHPSPHIQQPLGRHGYRRVTFLSATLRTSFTREAKFSVDSVSLILDGLMLANSTVFELPPSVSYESGHSAVQKVSHRTA